MFAIKHANAVPELDSWGTVTDLGSEILEGECAASGKMVFGTPTDPVSCAYFAVTPGKFRMVYPFTEHAVVVEGSVKLTDESTGHSATYGPGDAWFIKKGTPIVWEVAGGRFVKNYFAVA